ncbi:MAG: glycosyltransferase family 39 protein [Clostridiales bacterium]|nr:glycosyltransferase family 39 protein [Clostridiales bacterium]
MNKPAEKHKTMIFYGLCALFSLLMFFVYLSNATTARTLLQISAVLVIIFAFLRWQSKKLDFHTLMACIFILGLIVRLVILAKYGVYKYEHDIFQKNGHLDYIKYFVQNGLSLPSHIQEQFYQPPLHHMLSSIVYNIGVLFRMSDAGILGLLQLVIIFVSFISFRFAAKIMSIASNGNKTAILIGTALFVMFPENIIIANTLNNDPTMLFFYVAALYYLARWMKDRTMKNAVLLGAMTALAVISKRNALSVVVVSLFAFIIVCVKDKKLHWKHILGYLSTAAPLPAYIFIRAYVKFGQGLTYVARLANNLQDVPNTFSKLFGISLKRIFSMPYASNFQEDGKNSFVEYAFKSSLFDEHKFSENFILPYILLSVALVFTIVWVVNAVRNYDAKNNYDNMFLFNLGLTYLLYLKFRIDYPQICTQVFRYAVTAVPSLAYFAAKAAIPREGEKLNRAKSGNFGGGALFRKVTLSASVAFSVVSFAFYMII